MIRRAIFAYEPGLRGPEPVVFYDEIPKANGQTVRTIAQHVIDGGTGNAEFFPGVDETPSIARLVAAFPPPAPETTAKIEGAP